MPRPRRMQTPVTSDRAIARYCPCGCGGPICITETDDPTAIPNYSEAQRLALAPDIKPQTVREAFSTGYITESIVDSIKRRKEVMAGMDKEVTALIKLAEEQGFTVVQDGTSIKWTNPEGGMVSTPTRVIGRGLQNIKSQLRRLGLDIPRTGKAQVHEEPETETTTLVVPLDEIVLPDEITAAYAAIATLTEFVQTHQHADESSEWESICAGLEAELSQARDERDQALKERDALQAKFDTLKSVLS